MAKMWDQDLFELDDGKVISLIIGERYTTSDGRSGFYKGYLDDRDAIALETDPFMKSGTLQVSTEDLMDADEVFFGPNHRQFEVR
jgi:hypothetical protein